MTLTGQRLPWVIQQVLPVHVLSLQVHWLEEHIDTVAEHSHVEEGGKNMLTLELAVSSTQIQQNVYVKLLR